MLSILINLIKLCGGCRFFELGHGFRLSEGACVNEVAPYVRRDGIRRRRVRVGSFACPRWSPAEPREPRSLSDLPSLKVVNEEEEEGEYRYPPDSHPPKEPRSLSDLPSLVVIAKPSKPTSFKIG